MSRIVMHTFISQGLPACSESPMTVDGAYNQCFKSGRGSLTGSYPLLRKTFPVDEVVPEAKRRKSYQRDTRGMPLTSHFFPGQEAGDKYKNTLDSGSYRAGCTWICHGVFGCKFGDCSLALDAADVLQLRHAAIARTSALMTQTCSDDVKLAKIFENDIHSLLQLDPENSSDTWSRINVKVDGQRTIPLCPSAYGVVLGLSGTSIYRATTSVRTGDAQGWRARCKSMRKEDQYKSVNWTGGTGRSQQVLDLLSIEQYVNSLVYKHEMCPAPGAAKRPVETHVTSKSWKERRRDMESYFGDKGLPCPGSKTMMKNVWRRCNRLKDKKQCSHSKCDICSGLDRLLMSLKGKNDPKSVKERAFALRVHKLHEKRHLGARNELDEAGFTARSNPRAVWTIICDAATSRNFQLPRFARRRPKSFGSKPFYQFKFLCTYSYGFGFCSFLLHDSVSGGSNSTCTVIWETLQRLYDHYGFWPDIIHIQLDNCSSDNKNEIVRALAAWLCDSKKCRQVRLYFLDVGHTHVIIDQIFGVITVGLRREELLTLECLVLNISTTLKENPSYQPKDCTVLYAVFDWESFFKQQCGIVNFTHANQFKRQDAEGQFHGMHDFLFTRQPAGLSLMQYREQFDFPFLPENSHGVAVLRRLPTSMPELAKTSDRSAWGWKSGVDVKETVSLVLRCCTSAITSERQEFVQSRWKVFESNVPVITEMLNPDLKPNLRNFSAQKVEFIPRLHAPSDGEPASATTCPDSFPENETELGKDKEFEDFCSHLNVRTRPFAIDPCVSSVRSQTEVDIDMRRYECDFLLFSEAITDNTAPVLPGTFCLAYVTPGNVGLCRIERLGPLQTTRSEHIDIKVTLMAHTVGNIPGLFGNFKEKTGAGARAILHRRELIVLNCLVISRSVKDEDPSKKNINKKFLSLHTLRVLSRILPEKYPVPDDKDIPATHLEKEKDTTKGVSSTRTAAKASKPTKVAGKAKPQARRKRLREESDSDSESGTGSDSSGSGSGKDGDGDSSSDDSDSSDDDAVSRGAPAHPAASSHPQLPATSTKFDHKEGTLVFCNMDSERKWGKQKYRVCPAFLEAIKPDGTFRIRWFTITQKDTNWDGDVKFVRHFKDPKFFTELKKNKKKVTNEHIDQCWSSQDWCKEDCLPLKVPSEMYNVKNAFSPQDKHDKLVLTASWVSEYLSAACRESNLVRSN